MSVGCPITPWEQDVTAASPRDNYIWGFVLKETGELFGSGGLVWEDAYQLYQVGYNISKTHWNHGYTTEAMRAILNFAAEKLDIKRVAGGHAKENLGSIDGTRSFDSREYFLDLDAV